MRIFIVIALIFLAFSGVVSAQTPSPDKLQEIKARQEQARQEAAQLEKQKNSVLSEIETLESRLLRESREARAVENKRYTARQKLAKLRKQQAKISAHLETNRAALSDLLAALQRLDTQPPPLLLINSDSAKNAARSAVIIRDLSGELKAKSDELRLELETSRRLEKEISEQIQVLNSTKTAVNQHMGKIRTIIQEKSTLSAKIDKNRSKRVKEAKALAKQAKSLSDLIAKFEAQADDITPRLKPKKGSRSKPAPRVKPRPGAVTRPVILPKGITRFSDARGSLPLPVQGRLLSKFGARQTDGTRAKGIKIKTRGGEHVIAPFYGRVEFAGPFHDDHVVILNVSDGYFIVLTGLAETFTQAGNIVKAGEPLGLMPRNAPVLFMELRKNRKSIDPKPWVGRAMGG